MKYTKILNEIHKLEKDYKILNNQLKQLNIIKGEKNSYLKEDKESLKKIWYEYITYFTKLKKVIRKTKYRKYIFFTNHNNLVLHKYILTNYFNSIIILEKTFGIHTEFIRIFLGENFIKDYGYFSRYIYRPRYINILNTPIIFIKPFKKFINPQVYKLLDSKNFHIKNTRRISTDYNNIFFFIKYRIDKILFFFSKHIGHIISSTRFTTRDKGLIDIKSLNKYLKIAKPGDILLTRGNWNASNLSIPGFWKHMSMYIGTGEYLKNNFNFKNKSKLKNNTHYIIEATGLGVNIVETENLTGHNDYLGVSRTVFSDEKIKRAIQNTLENIGKGYDHIFNFYSDKNQVCSELILKAYAKEFKDDEGIEIQLEKIGISLTYPPNNFISLLIKEKEKCKKASVKPLFFIDSIEKTKTNFISTTKELLKSGKRSRSSLFLK